VTVLIARLFAGLACIAFVVAILGRVRVLPRANLYLGMANVSFSALYWQLFIALVCAGFGFAYFVLVRLTQRPINQSVGLVGFLLVAFASVVWLISSFLTASGSPLNRWLVILLFAAIFSFMLGVAVSAANMAWVFLRK
jgi:hypothetical protein